MTNCIFTVLPFVAFAAGPLWCLGVVGWRHMQRLQKTTHHILMVA